MTNNKRQSIKYFSFWVYSITNVRLLSLLLDIWTNVKLKIFVLFTLLVDNTADSFERNQQSILSDIRCQTRMSLQKSIKESTVYSKTWQKLPRISELGDRSVGVVLSESKKKKKKRTKERETSQNMKLRDKTNTKTKHNHFVFPLISRPTDLLIKNQHPCSGFLQKCLLWHDLLNSLLTSVNTAYHYQVTGVSGEAALGSLFTVSPRFHV